MDKELETRLNEIEQEMKLSSFDSIIIAMLIFMVAISFGILSRIDNLNLTSPTAIIMVLFVVASAIPAVIIVIYYVQSIISGRNRLKKRVDLIMLLGDYGLYVVIAIVFIAILETIDKIWKLPDNPGFAGYLIVGIILLLTLIGHFYYISPKTKEFFKKEYPHLFLRRTKKLSKEKMEKSFKKFKTNLEELNRFARDY
jgi:hypothetical protein